MWHNRVEDTELNEWQQAASIHRRGQIMSTEERLEKIEKMIAMLIERQTIKAWYSTDEFARLVGKAEFTVREWCRNGRVHAENAARGEEPSRRGPSPMKN